MSEIAQARDRAARLYRSVGFRSVYVRGAHARLDGASRAACPYKADGSGTWKATYRKAWLRGFDGVVGPADE